MESELPQSEILPSSILIQSFSGELIILILILLLLLVLSIMISSFERAFHSLNHESVKNLRTKYPEKGKIIQKYWENPEGLRASLLVQSSFIQVGIAVLTYFILGKIIRFQLVSIRLSEYGFFNFSDGQNPVLTGNILQILSTIFIAGFILVFLSESLAKRYGNAKNALLAFKMAGFAKNLHFVSKPFSSIIVRLASWIDNRLENIKSRFFPGGKEELDKAIELSVSESTRANEELDILKSILTFNDVAVKQIMKSRMDVIALDHKADFEEVISVVKDSGFSRIPVYREDFDNVFAILYVKDLLAYLDKPKDFNWQKILRKNVLFVPESKKIRDLLKEFQLKRMHLAIVVDEYGGSAGIVTMEDILEEIFGDIRDEFDEIDEVHAEKIDENTYIFEGKTLINDVCRIIGEDIVIFDEIKGESDSIAGMLLEITGDIPDEGQEIRFKQFTFIPMSVSDRRVERVKLCRNN
ncbi:MAG TPA: gliding motility-associated protein GldE [Saprospirales bacterium]|nr:gliding motility-associated protein GldE [Saprospirales bacterium]HRQ28843.1 gliding motility-associated protein GldE [Saprospiraceae bacterium]